MPLTMKAKQPDPVANRIDSITAEVIAHRLRSSSDEMMATLVKTSYSPNIKERRDCSTGIFDAQGRLLALTAIAPLHLSSLIGTIESVMQRFPIDTMGPEDAFVVNDPYSGGGSHLPDITMVAPVFCEGRVVAFVANIAHHSDVGGKVPGSESSDCTSIFQEGIRLPPVQLFRDGRLNQGVLDIILLNSRTPREREGDLKAQIATNVVGRRRVKEIFDRFGTATTLAGIEAWLDYSEARARAGIRGLPNGAYENEDFIDHDGISPRMVRARVRVTDQGRPSHFRFHRVRPADGRLAQHGVERHARGRLLRRQGHDRSRPATQRRLFPRNRGHRPPGFDLQCAEPGRGRRSRLDRQRARRRDLSAPSPRRSPSA